MNKLTSFTIAVLLLAPVAALHAADATKPNIVYLFADDLGYRTGIFGKWHNGDDPDTPEYRAAFAEAFKDMPNKKLKGGLGVNAHGFDEAWVYYGGGADYFTRRTVGGKDPGELVAQSGVSPEGRRLHRRLCDPTCM